MEGESLLKKAGKLANLAEKQKMVAKTVNYDDKLGEAQATNVPHYPLRPNSRNSGTSSDATPRANA